MRDKPGILLGFLAYIKVALALCAFLRKSQSSTKSLELALHLQVLLMQKNDSNGQKQRGLPVHTIISDGQSDTEQGTGKGKRQGTGHANILLCFLT